MSNTSPVVDLLAPSLSVAREKVIEHRFVAELAVTMLRRGQPLDVLRGEFDGSGHDIVLEAAGVTRHVQLKATAEGGKRRDVDVNVRLRAKPSGCVAWLSYDPATLAITAYRWLGGAPGEPLPDLGSRITRHSKGDATGAKAARPALRNVPKSVFSRSASIEELADCLFGRATSLSTSLVLAQLRERFGSGWRSALFQFAHHETFFDMINFGHMIDGYRVLEQLCVLDPVEWTEERACRARLGIFSDDPGQLWTQLFLEHRRWRMASPAEPPPEEARWLDVLARKTIAAINEAISEA